MELDNRAKKSKDEAVRGNVTALEEYKKAGTLFTYACHFQEVDTLKIIDHALSCGKEVFCPRIDLSCRSMDICRVCCRGDLKPGSYNIPEPCTEPVEKKGFDILLIPGLAFDPRRNRLGRGGGYFDKFLESVTGWKVGICYAEQIVRKIPAEEHDIRMDCVVTDREII